MTLEELKTRRLTNQYLTEKGEKLTVVRDLCGFQAQFMVNALHSMKLRCSDFTPETASDGLVKNWTVRGTVHVFAESDLALFKHCDNGKSYCFDEWLGYGAWRRPDGAIRNVNDGDCKRVWSLTPERQKYFSHIILDSLKTATQTRDELKEICQDNGMTDIELASMFEQWGGGIRDLCERGFMNYVVQEKKAYCLAPPFDPIPEDEANLEIARRYFTNFAPATIHDAQYYFHATAAQVKDWLSRLPVSSCECEGKTYYYIENGKTYEKAIPDCMLLAGFDQLMLGYEKKESVFIAPEHIRGIFNLAGIVMPPILLSGRVVGKWQKKNTKLTFTLFETVSDKDKKLICDTAQGLWDDIKKIEWSIY
ncbi:MAG: winged helix DNA-binding domain-containing protein [Clostridiales bacterium]|nr:winged helix DNA-binding domain-containing protein [Clostridiales bacterium]